MQFGSRVRRAFWSRVLLGLIPDSLLAGGAAFYLEGGIELFVGLFVGLQVLYFARWILGSITDWVLFAIHGRKQMSGYLTEYLRENSYPEPGRFEDSAESYLTRVVEDKTLPVSLRIKAGAELGTLGTWRNLLQYGISSRLELAYESALETYKRTFPPKTPKGDEVDEFEEEKEAE